MMKKKTKKNTEQEVQVSQNERMRAAAKSRKKEKRKKELLLAFGVIFVVLILAALVGSFALFYVEGVSVSGNDGQYTDEQIIAAAGLADVSNMLSFRSNGAEKAIEWALPYIEEAEVHRVLPGKITVEVSYAVETYSVQVGNVWLHLSRMGKVLSSEQIHERGMIELRGIGINRYTVGEPAEFEDADKFESVRRLYDAAEKEGLQNLTFIDVSNTASVKFAFGSRFYVEGGNIAMTEKKMPLIANIIAEKKDTDSRYSLTLSSDGSVTIGDYKGSEPYIPEEIAQDSELVPADPQIPTVVIDPDADSVG